MNITLKLFLIIILFIQLFLIIKTVRRKKLAMKYASFWILLVAVMGVLALFPSMVYFLSKLCGFEVSSNMVFILGFFFLFYTIFALTMSLSIQNEKIKKLIQEVSLLKKKINDDGKKE